MFWFKGLHTSLVSAQYIKVLLPPKQMEQLKQTGLKQTEVKQRDLASLSLPAFIGQHYQKYGSLTPIQEKAVRAGLLDGSSLLACAPTASGKTFIATMAIAKALEAGSKAIYIVPLKALGAEKYKEYASLLKDTPYNVGISTGDLDSDSSYLAKYHLIILTTEKLDSLLRHRAGWLHNIRTIIIDEIHLLNDPTRGPTLEIVITLLRSLLQPQMIGLSATIGNPQELADWLQAALIEDSWRPVELKKGIAVGGKVEYYS